MENVWISEGAAALRDFFASVDAEDLKAASAAISRHFRLPLDADIDWTGVEYDFNRLFVGPAAVPAPPYASAYGPAADTGKPTLMGRPALEARDAYRRLGLAVPDQGSTPDDHLAYELDAVVAMESAEEEAPGLSGLEEVRAWLVGAHMAAWIPRFVAGVLAQPDLSQPVRMTMGALSLWLEAARNGTAPTGA